jgi:hypothetical protein
MASHMKTTVHIPDALLRDAQALAAKEKTTLKALITEGLSQVVQHRTTSKPFKLKDASVAGQGIAPEFENASWATMRAAIYEDRE